MPNEKIQEAVREVLLSVGEDPEREGLRGTPLRVSKMYDELLSGYATDPAALINSALFEEQYNEMVIVRDIEFYSLCEHHLLPFVGYAHVAYVPHGKIIGLSKIPRIVDMFARRLQVQERMTRQIADFLTQALRPHGVAVVSLYPGLVRTEAVMAAAASGAFDLSNSESPEFIGRVIAALARDPARMERTGRVLVAAAVALELGVQDVDGRQPAPLTLETA